MQVLILSTLYAFLASFAFSSICGYIVGMVGSSASPISAMAISAVLFISLILLLILGQEANEQTVHHAVAAAAFAVLIGGLVACGAAIANDTMQDLKAGQMVGATPWKQQAVLFLGVTLAALIVPLILNLLLSAYGMGEVLPREGMLASQALAVPQAQVMKSIAYGVLTQQLQWGLLLAGVIIGLVVITLNHFLAKRQWGLSPIAIGLGIYLPIGTTMSLVLGSFIAYLVNRHLESRFEKGEDPQQLDNCEQRGVLLNSGIVAGGALMGIILAIPFALKQNTEILSLVGPSFTPYAEMLGLVSGLFLCIWIYRKIVR